MTALRLGPLPKTETLKLAISLTVELKAQLDRGFKHAQKGPQIGNTSVTAAKLT